MIHGINWLRLKFTDRSLIFLQFVNFSKQEDALKNVDFPAADKALMMKMDSKALLGD